MPPVPLPLLLRILFTSYVSVSRRGRHGPVPFVRERSKKRASYFRRTATGTLIARVVSDVQLMSEALAERIGDLFQDSLTVALLVFYLFSLNTRLAFATVVLAPMLLAPVLRFSRILRTRSRQSQDRIGELTCVLDETVKHLLEKETLMADELPVLSADSNGAEGASTPPEESLRTE